MNSWFATDAVMKLFTTGRFAWRAPLLPWPAVSFELPEAVGALDWYSVNYYSRPAINSRFQLTGLSNDEPMTGMGMPLVAADMFRHLMHAHATLQVRWAGWLAGWWACRTAGRRRAQPQLHAHKPLCMMQQHMRCHACASAGAAVCD